MAKPNQVSRSRYWSAGLKQQKLQFLCFCRLAIWSVSHLTTVACKPRTTRHSCSTFATFARLHACITACHLTNCLMFFVCLKARVFFPAALLTWSASSPRLHPMIKTPHGSTRSIRAVPFPRLAPGAKSANLAGWEIKDLIYRPELKQRRREQERWELAERMRALVHHPLLQ